MVQKVGEADNAGAASLVRLERDILEHEGLCRAGLEADRQTGFEDGIGTGFLGKGFGQVGIDEESVNQAERQGEVGRAVENVCVLLHRGSHEGTDHWADRKSLIDLIDISYI